MGLIPSLASTVEGELDSSQFRGLIFSPERNFSA